MHMNLRSMTANRFIAAFLVLVLVMEFAAPVQALNYNYYNNFITNEENIQINLEDKYSQEDELQGQAGQDESYMNEDEYEEALDRLSNTPGVIYAEPTCFMHSIIIMIPYMGTNGL